MKMLKCLNKVRIISGIGIIGCILFVALLTSESRYKDLPTIVVSKTEKINATSAYQYVKEVAEKYTYRIYGSREVEELGQRILDEFKEFGLTAYEQRFEALRPDINKFHMKFDILDNDVSIMNDSYVDLIENVSGTNIIGISLGKTDDIILIGAHRDIAKGIQGAEDNASGTGLLLQLAKELAEVEHYYSYVFVSFDGEEAHEKGSKYFVNNFDDLHKIKLSIILDEVGYSKADSLTLYNRFGAFSQMPLQLQAVLFSCMTETTNVIPNCYEKDPNSNGLINFLSYMLGMSFHSANTDCNPFYLSHIPAFGLRAWDKNENTEAPIHCKEDTIENISVDALGMSGDFVKTLIRTVEEQPHLLDSMDMQGKYVIAGNKYLPRVNVIISEILFIVTLFLISVVFLDKIHWKNIMLNIKIYSIISILLLICACMIVLFFVWGLRHYLSEISIFWLICIFVGSLFCSLWILRKFFVKKIVVKYGAEVQILFTLFCIPFITVASSLEYAITIYSVAIVSNIISLKIENNIVCVINRIVYSLLHIMLILATFNVFIRGVNIQEYIFLIIINLYLFMSMHLYVFSLC